MRGMLVSEQADMVDRGVERGEGLLIAEHWFRMPDN